MDITSIKTKLEDFKTKVSNTDYTKAELIKVVAVQFFNYLLQEKSLESILNERLYYYIDLGKEAQVVKLQNLIAEHVVEILRLFNSDTARQIEEKFDCSSYRKHSADTQIAAVEALAIMSDIKNFNTIGIGRVNEVLQQYATFEQLASSLSEIGLKDPKIAADYSVLTYSYKQLKSDFKHYLEVHYYGKNIDSYQELVSWVLDKQPYPAYRLFPSTKGTRVLNWDESHVRKLVYFVIDDLVVTIENRQEIEPSHLNKEEKIVARFKTLALGEQGTIFEDGQQVGAIDNSRESLQKKYKLLLILMQSQSRTGKESTITTEQDIAIIVGGADYSSLYTKINSENLNNSGYMIGKYGMGYMLKRRPVKEAS